MGWQDAFLAQRLEHEIGIDGVARVAEPPAGIAEPHLVDAVLDPEQPAIVGVTRRKPLDPVLRSRSAENVEFRMGGEHLVMHAADPMPSRANLAIRQRRQVRPQWPTK